MERGDLLQLKAGLSGELRVVGEEGYRPLDLINNALTRTMARGEKLKIGQCIIRAVASVFMVNRFLWSKFSAKVLFHHVAVLKNLTASNPTFVRESQANVSLCRDVSLNLTSFGWAQAFVLCQLERLATLRAAKLLLPIDRSTRFPLDGHRLSTLNAVDLPPVVRQHSPLASARGRAILRFFSKLLHVRSYDPRHSLEWFAAGLAGVLYRLGYVMERRKSMLLFVSAVARGSIELLVRASGKEGLTAVKTLSLHWHSMFLRVIVNNEQSHGECALSITGIG